MFTVEVTYTSHTIGKQRYTSKPFPTAEAAIAYADRVMQHAIANPDIIDRWCLPNVFEHVVVSEFDIRDYLVYSANQRYHDYLQRMSGAGF